MRATIITMTGKTIYHVELHDGTHHYFGSVAAIYEVFDAKTLRIAKTSLWNYRITPDNPYQNSVCTIRKSVLTRKPTEALKNKSKS